MEMHRRFTANRRKFTKKYWRENLEKRNTWEIEGQYWIIHEGINLEWVEHVGFDQDGEK